MYGLVFVLSFVCACVTFFKIFYLYFLHFFSVFVKYKGSRTPVKHILAKFYQKMKKLFNGTYNKSVFEKNLSKIEKIVKIFSIFDKNFFKNSIVLCALRIHVNKIQI